MTHFGIICPTSTGHLNPMITLGRELQRRGHKITFFQVPDAKAKVESAGFNFQVIGESEFPLGAMSQVFSQLGKLSGVAAINYSIRWMLQTAEMILNDAPEAIKAAKIDALLVDQIAPSGGTVAEYLNIPFISVCCALIANADNEIPPFVTPWNYSTAWWAKLRNEFGYKSLARLTQPIVEKINEYRQQWGLPLHVKSSSAMSQLAQISQQPIEFEYPRTDLPDNFHFTSPWHDITAREVVDFPFDKLTGQPLIYASMGTLQNRQQEIFHCIASACAELPVQLVISLGNTDATSIPELPGSPLIVSYAPQLELLKKATITITHAGLNTVLESLTNGVPMVAIPITNDQPGVAARLAWTGAGEVVPLFRLNVSRLQTAIQKVLTEDSYRQNARRLQTAIQQAGGVTRAANIVEQAVLISQREQGMKSGELVAH